MTEPVVPRCADCVHFVVDGGHPLHPACCDRLNGRLLSAAAERRNDHPQGCGPEGKDFVPKAVAR